jgi:hypothetical protein
MTMTANNQQATPGISSALDVPVMHGSKEEKSALFQGVAKKMVLRFLWMVRRFAAERQAPLW